MKRKNIVVLCALAAAAVLSQGVAFAAERLSKATQSCLECHESMPGIVKQWEDSVHWNAGVGCYECHKANKGENDAIDHYGYLVATIVSPKDCGQCHPKEAAEQEASHHAEAGNILNSKDGLLGQTVGGEPAVAVGCRQCHGSIVKTLEDGTLDPATWPNTGIGRVNPDGSKGSCSACHTRHRFSKEQARKPEVCGKCHVGPDHPQKEVYEESKHGILYYAYEDELNMDKPKWVAGEDYYDAPTCASCHMSAAPGVGVTHDVGDRLSWNLRAPVSKPTANSKEKLATMKEVCSACHADPFVEGFYTQLDQFVKLYNDKFAIPAKEIRQLLMDEGVISTANFDDKIDWTYWELWHHEGRRARHGAAMSGPDYAWWHGIYDVAKAFYNHLLPQAKEACEKAGKPELYDQIIEKYIDGRPEHQWYTRGFDQKRLKEIKQYYKKRYNQDVN
ncbi:MAG: cytochrome C552 [Desulfuromonadales bacterium]|nr:cytochrome C552 [Desulfuromonadales bacterium]NIS40980.1 cytochrome C552 [Desulfuromonadales bacterium]